MDLEFDVSGNFDISNIKEEISQKLYDNLEDACSMIELRAKEKASVGTSGNMRDHITHQITRGGALDIDAKVYVPVYSSSGYPYAKAVEEGTPPHWMPWTGGENTWQLWAKRKGIPPGALWYAVGMRGTRPHPFLKPAGEEVLGSFDWRL